MQRIKGKNIVIVGGGAAGLELATTLGQKLGRNKVAEITLIDKSLTHVWKPLLHEISAGTLRASDCEVDYIQHAYQHHFRFERGAVTQIDRIKKCIHLAEVVDTQGIAAKARSVPYDLLVIAVGSRTNTFNTPGVFEHAKMLNETADAEVLRAEVLERINRIHLGSLEKLSVAIVGAGATGVELAAELFDMAKELERYGASFGPFSLSTTIVDAGPRVLPTAGGNLSQRATELLDAKGVKIIVGQPVTLVDETGVTLKDGRHVDADLVVWASGIKAPEFLTTLGLETNRLNQIVVLPTLQTTDDPDIYAMGDCSAYTPKGQERPLAATAQVAHQQAVFLAKNIQRRLRANNAKDSVQFEYVNKGMLVSLGAKNAVGHVGAKAAKPRSGVSLHGVGAKVLYVSLYWLHQLALHGVLTTARLFAIDKLRRIRRFGVKVY